jgi:phosphocarrier protein
VELRREIEVTNKLGLHARAAAKLVNLASGFDSDIQLSCNGQSVSAKSIMGIMMLAAARGSRIEVVTRGPDAVEAMDKIERLFEERFGEDE